MRIIIELCLFVTVCCCYIKCKQLIAEQDRSLRNFVKSMMKCKGNIGASVSLVRNGEIVFAEGFGYRDFHKKLPMEKNTKVSIASLTKSFTATLAAQAVGKGLSTWDTPIVDILGANFALEGPFRTQHASLRDTFSHKLGVPGYEGVVLAGLNMSRQEICMRRIRHFTSLYDFRLRYKYSNHGYVLGSYVTEVLTKKSWEQEVKQLFADLGMTNTIHAEEIRPSDWGTNIAYSYSEKGGVQLEMPEQDQLPLLIEGSPAGGIFSTPGDMGKWLLFHLNGGKSNGKQIVPEVTLSDLYHATTPTESWRTITRASYPVDKTTYAYGMGFFKGTYRGYERLYHDGSYSSYHCRMTLIMASSVGVWACTTSPYAYGETVEMINMYALDLLLGETPWLNETTACTFPSPWSNSKPTSSNTKRTTSTKCTRKCKKTTDLRKYTGDYSHPGFGLFKIYLNGKGHLRYKFGILLQGDLSRTNNPMEMIMSIGYPLNYYANPSNVPIYFGGYPNGEGINAVKVPFLEGAIPPVFKRT